MIKPALAILLFCSAAAQHISRIQRTVEDMFAISDWETYRGFTQITGVVESQRHIYFGTNGAGILRYDKFENKFVNPLTRSNGLRSNHITRIYSSLADSTSEYETAYGIETPRGSQVIETDQLDVGTISTRFADSFVINPQQRGFAPMAASDVPQFATPYFLEPNLTVRGREFQRFKLRGKYVDSDYGSWLLVDNFGLFFAETSSSLFEPIKHGPISNTIYSLATWENSIFLGQAGSAKKPVFTRWDLDGNWEHWAKDFVTDLSGDRVNRAVTIGDSLWLATNGGLVWFDPKSEEFRLARDNRLYAMEINDIADGGSEVILGTSKGLFAYRKQSKSVHQYKFPQIGTVDVLSVASNGNTIFAVTRFGIFQIDREDNSILDFRKEISFQSLRTTLVRYMNGKFWFNNTDGIYYYDPIEDEATQIVLTSSTFQLQVRAIKEDGAGNLFVGTNKGLLLHSREDDRWVWITKREGLPSNFVNDILLEEKSIVIATANGISRFFWQDLTRF